VPWRMASSKRRFQRVRLTEAKLSKVPPFIEEGKIIPIRNRFLPEQWRERFGLSHPLGRGEFLCHLEEKGYGWELIDAVLLRDSGGIVLQALCG